MQVQHGRRTVAHRVAHVEDQQAPGGGLLPAVPVVQDLGLVQHVERGVRVGHRGRPVAGVGPLFGARLHELQGGVVASARRHGIQHGVAQRGHGGRKRGFELWRLRLEVCVN